MQAGKKGFATGIMNPVLTLKTTKCLLKSAAAKQHHYTYDKTTKQLPISNNNHHQAAAAAAANQKLKRVNDEARMKQCERCENAT